MLTKPWRLTSQFSTKLEKSGKKKKNTDEKKLKNEKLHNDRIYDVTSLSKLSVEQIQIITHILLVYDILKWLCDKC